ncbi:glycosyltransferase [Patescibacteria group bacterium]|nr:glycosyltransferase [Patescibacteria group bacterium]
MKILFINQSDGQGGASQLAYTLKKKLEEKGHTTSMFVAKKYSEDKNIFLIKSPNKLFVFISKLSKKIFKKDIPNYIKNKIKNLIKIKNDIKNFDNSNLLKSKEFKEADIIHCHNLQGGYFNLGLLETISKNKPVVWTPHDMWAITPHEAWIIKDINNVEKFKMEIQPPLKPKVSEEIFQEKIKIYDNSQIFVVAISKWFLKEIKKSILKNKKTYLIHNGIDENIFKPTKKTLARKKLNLPQNKTIITFLANIASKNKQKGWKYLEEVIEHYSKNKNFLFLCIGEKNQNTKNIQYIDHLHNNYNVSLYYSASDIFINPSMAESFGLTIAEAMSCGTPIVTFPVGIAKESIEHKKTGYIAKYQDSQDLINGIEYILNLDKEKIEELSKKTRQNVLENYTLSKMTDNYIKLYKEIITKKN